MKKVILAAIGLAFLASCSVNKGYNQTWHPPKHKPMNVVKTKRR